MGHTRCRLAMLIVMLAAGSLLADPPRALAPDQKLDDHRLGPLRTLNDHFPMNPVADAADWPARRTAIRDRILLAAGLIPMPTRTPLNAVVHGRVDRPEYTVDRVIFESMPGHFVTGSLYRPKSPPPDGSRYPGVLCPHGHWPDGRFHDAGEASVRKQIADGGERFLIGGRHPIQARCVQLARMGCVVFNYDMIGYADSVQLEHRPGVRPDDPQSKDWLFFSPRAEMHQQNMFGLQTWNSIRALDFLSSLEDVDNDRLAVTGASGGATQTMILAAVDDRLDAAFPAVMVSTAMQGGCTCENATYLRIGQGNIDIAAAIAPRPLAMTSADDWTRELETKGFPDLADLYKKLNVPDRVSAFHHLQFKHNYNAMNRRHMYSFINAVFKLGLPEPILENDYTPLTRDEATVWAADHPRPEGDQVGEPHERALLQWWANDVKQQIEALKPAEKQAMIDKAVTLIIGRSYDDVGPVEWKLTEKRDLGDALLMTGLLTVTNHHEQIPALFLYPKQKRNDRVVIVLSDKGKLGLLDDSFNPTPDIAKQLSDGFSIASIDLIGQGEATDDGKPLTAARLNNYGEGKSPWQQAAAYTFGYNPPLFCQRVHDILALVRFIKTDDKHGPPVERITIVADGPQVGPIARAALMLLDGIAGDSIINTRDFHFEKISRFDDPMFLPGILRYGGLRAFDAKP